LEHRPLAGAGGLGKGAAIGALRVRWQLREDRAEYTEFVTIAYWEIVEGM